MHIPPPARLPPCSPLQRRLAGPNCARLRQWPAANVPGPPLPKHQRRLQPAARSIDGTSSCGTRLVGTGAHHQQAPRLRNSPPPPGQASDTVSPASWWLAKIPPGPAFPGLSGPVRRLTLELRLRLVELRPPIGRTPLSYWSGSAHGQTPPPIVQTPLPTGRNKPRPVGRTPPPYLSNSSPDWSDSAPHWTNSPSYWTSSKKDGTRAPIDSARAQC